MCLPLPLNFCPRSTTLNVYIFPSMCASLPPLPCTGAGRRVRSLPGAVRGHHTGKLAGVIKQQQQLGRAGTSRWRLPVKSSVTGL